MPIVIGKEDKTQPTEKPTSQSHAVVRKRTVRSSNESGPISPKIMIAAVVVAILFALYMYHRNVNPLFSTEKGLTKVAPLPGFQDQFPYNTKEWQEKFKQGKAGFLSGVPRMAGPPTAGGPPVGGGQPTGGGQ